MKKGGLLIIILLVLSVLVVGLIILQQTGRVLPSRPAVNDNLVTVKDSPQSGQVAVIDSNIIVTKPLSNDVISSPVEITGRAQVANGEVRLRLKDAAGKVLVSALTTALGGGEGWGFYSAKLEFASPLGQLGWLEVYTLAADDSEQNLISLPVVFKDFIEPKVTVYFSNSQKDPGALDCSGVYPLERAVSYPPSLLASAVTGLFKGPTAEEQAQGYLTSLPDTEIKVQRLEIQDGIVYADFSQELEQGVGGSCRVAAIYAQLKKTLEQFSDAGQVIISIDGRTEDILQP